MSDQFRAIALCALGLEKVLSNEIERIGLAATGRAPGRVFFDADSGGLFRANLELRTAERILLEAARFKAADFDALFEGARSPAWERFFAREDKLVIERVRSRDSQLNAQTSIQSIVHKSIYETLGRKYHLTRLPETGRERSLRVYIEDDECTLGLDLSGEALHKRGWRRAAGEAPLKETLAAGLLFLSGWKRRLPLLDPFCGAGTILIEAALFALDRAPGLDRHFDLETMPIAKEGHASAFTEERQRARAAVRKDVDVLLVGRDSDPKTIDLARANAERAGVAPLLDLAVGRAEEARPLGDNGILLTNPPWGERLGTEAEADALYARLGEAWAVAPNSTAPIFAGWGLGFITNRPDFGERFGRRPQTVKNLVNGSEEQWFNWYPQGWEDAPDRPRERFKRSEVGPSRGPKPRPGASRGNEPRGAARRVGERDGARAFGDTRREGPAREGSRPFGRDPRGPAGSRRGAPPARDGAARPGSEGVRTFRGSGGEGPRDEGGGRRQSYGASTGRRGPPGSPRYEEGRPSERGPRERPGHGGASRSDSRDHGQRGPMSRGQEPRSEGAPDQGPRGQGTHGQGPQGQGPRGQGPRGQGPRGQGPRREGGRSDGPPRSSRGPTQGGRPPVQGPERDERGPRQDEGRPEGRPSSGHRGKNRHLPKGGLDPRRNWPGHGGPKKGDAE